MPGAIVLLTGRPYSGKSTTARLLATSLPAEVVGYDAINAARGLHGGEGVPVEEWLRTNDLAHDRARSLLEEGRTVVVDDTSSPRFLRDRWREVAAAAHARFVLVLVDAAPEVVRARLAANRSDGVRPDVSDSVMEAHLASFEPPRAGRAPPSLRRRR